ncbi:hypothetical protein [Nocardia carnea]|uniref:hypothetical protein n=1 Tax=Nocardia carnea TaxID=37328 RepID=UPI002454EB4D|nr:hypothetical protein [Nocardia carnea]
MASAQLAAQLPDLLDNLSGTIDRLDATVDRLDRTPARRSPPTIGCCPAGSADRGG